MTAMILVYNRLKCALCGPHIIRLLLNVRTVIVWLLRR